MMTFDIGQLVPRFLLRDQNGKAMAASIAAALNAMIQTVQTGIDIMEGVDAMPEWRLDELAWEYNCLYDYRGSLSEKRRWIRNALPVNRVYGTVMAIYRYLEGVFDNVAVEECWEYNGDPFHFRITVTGEWTRAKGEWASKAVQAAKNVRSILDDIAVGSRSSILISAHAGIAARFPYLLTGSDLLCGYYLE